VHRTETSFEALVATYPDDVHEVLVELDTVIRSCLPGRSRSIWEGKSWGGTNQRIVGFGDIVQPRPRGGSAEWFLVGLARQSRTYSLYVNAVDDDEYLLASYSERLGG
jgi:hypothetical protein